MKIFLSFIFLIFVDYGMAASSKAPASAYQKLYNQTAPKIEALYRHFHQNPELSLKEFKTAKKMADELRSLGVQVTENVGGTGVVGVLKNGKGPTIWLRADMDGLPIQEQTGKDYASKNPGVMHACGHDTHIAALIGYAETLITLKDQWKGTLVFLVQPAEELGAGAHNMINAGLFKKFPEPDYILGLHVGGEHDAGVVTYTKGYAMAAVDSIDIDVKGYGGHGARPSKTIDPVVLASKIVVNSQTLVSRNTDPRDPVVLTFGSIHGGTKHNIIPDSVHLQGTLRTYSEDVRKKMKEGIKRVAEAMAQAEGAAKPLVKFSQGLPATHNHVAFTERMIPIFETVVGKENVKEVQGIMGAEDFGLYSRNQKYPSSFFFIGGAPKNRSNFGTNHNSKFAPEYKKVLAVGVEIMTRAVIDLAPTKSQTTANN